MTKGTRKTSRTRSTIAAPRIPPALLGAHVSVAGGTDQCGPRAAAIGADAIQIFTKNANQWRERAVTRDEAAAFRAAITAAGVTFTVSHDSYLINLASPDAALRAKSLASFIAELERSTALGLNAVVSHPGNFIDERDAGITRNADAIAHALTHVRGPVRLLLETTAGAGTVLGATFDELAELRARVPARLRKRIGICVDTCHVYAAGYDLVNDFDGVWNAFDRALGLQSLECLHVNDSQGALGSKRDRHEQIGKGKIGMRPFTRLMTDTRFRHVPKILETPKGPDGISNDRRALKALRSASR